MAEDDLFIAGSNFELQNERIQHLFGVEISVTSDEDVLLEGSYNNAKVHFKSSSNSAKAKAQKYLQAVLGESEDFIKKILVLGEADFNMVLSEKDNIEKLFQIYCSRPTLGKTRICLQGRRDCVTSAFRYINSSMSKKSELWDTQDPHEDKNAINRELENLQLNENVTSVDLSARGGQVPRYLSDFKEVDDSLLFGGDIETDSCISPTQIQDAANWRVGRDRSNNSSPEDETDRILSDPDHSNNVEKALKLGYSEDQIVTVLRKLGTTAPSVEFNNLLSELIKEGATSPDSGINSAPFPSDTSDNNDNVILPENADDSSNLKPIVIDGSNVAMSHGYKEVFSCRGIQIAADYFRQRGHKKITVFVPQWRKESSRPGAQIKDQEIMKQLEKDKVLVFTPSRRIAGKRIVCYDDRFILDLAHDKNGIVVSNDNYRDLHNEKALYKKVAEEQLLPYVFAEDKFMPPEDPLGKHGPTLDNFLRIKPVVTEPLQPCPYGKKCTYGNKCRFAHPERGNRPQRSVTDILTEQSDQKIKDRAVKLEEKKKKEKTKQLLKRTKSLFPDEPCSSVEMKTTRFYNKSESVDESKDYKLSRDKGNKSDINAILDEHRKRLSEQIKSREASPVPTFDIQKVSNQSSDNIVHIEPQITELQPFVSTLSTPQFSTQTSEGTQSDNHRGVIQLVKKLSDEANNESFFVNDRNQSSSNVTTQSSQPKTSWTQTRTHSQSQEPPPQSRFASLPYISSQQLATGHNSPSYPSHSDTGRYYSVPATSTRQNAMIDWSRGFIGGGGNQGYHNTVGGNQGYQNTVGGNQGYQNTVGGNQGYHNTVGGNQGYQNTVGGNQGYQNTVGYMDSVYRYPPNTVLDNRAVYPDQTHNPNQILRQNSYSDAQLQALQAQEQARMQNLHHRGANNRNVPVGGGQIMRQTSGITSPPIQPPSPYLASGYYSPSDYQSPIPSNMWPPPPQAPYQQPVYLPTSQPYMPPVSYPEDAEILSSDSRFCTYYQLSNLFPEPKVRAVMNKHPNERDPQELCKLLCLFNTEKK